MIFFYLESPSESPGLRGDTIVHVFRVGEVEKWRIYKVHTEMAHLDLESLYLGNVFKLNGMQDFSIIKM